MWVLAPVLALLLGMWLGARSKWPQESAPKTINRQRVIDNTLNDVYCRLSVTEHGVGVRAVRAIPRGTDPFKTVDPVHDIVSISRDDIARAHPGVREMTDDYMVSTEGIVPMTRNGLNAVTIDFFMNHNPKDPNMTIINGDDAYVTFQAARDIQAGEELTINYKDFESFVIAFEVTSFSTCRAGSSESPVRREVRDRLPHGLAVLRHQHVLVHPQRAVPRVQQPAQRPRGRQIPP